MCDYIYNKLELAAKNQDLIEIYANSDEDEGFEVGSALWVTEELIAIRNLDKFGRPNGIAIFLTEPIGRIVLDSNYLRRIASDMLHHPPREIPDMPQFNTVEKALQYFAEHKISISIFREGDLFVTGYVLETGDDGFLFASYNLGGLWDSTSAIAYEVVTRIDAFSNHEINLSQNQ